MFVPVSKRIAGPSLVQLLEPRRLFSASIAGVLYNDVNSNGRQDAGESGLSAWTVYLDSNHNAKLDAGEKTATTTASGAYSFTGLGAGNYIVAEVAPSSWKQTTKTPGGTVGVPTIRNYQLNGTLNDANGGPALSKNGGSVSSTGYTFAATQGLSLSKGVPVDNYSIEMLLTLKTPGGYQKLIDFKNRTSDAGLYALNNSLVFFGSSTNSTAVFTAGKAVDVVLTRSSSTKLVTAYANGVKIFSFTDTAGVATFSASNATAWFLQDDLNTNHEYASGFLDRLQVFDHALSQTEVSAVKAGGYAVGTSEYLVKLSSSQAVTGISFGNVKPVVPPAHLKGFAYTDANGNGVKDSGETAIASAVVFLDTNHNGKLDSGEVSQKTLADGSYDFAGLAAGTYNVGIVRNTGFALTSPKITGPVLTHDYALANKLTDGLAGPSLVSTGGTLSSSGYAFPAAKGLSLSNAISSDNYSIELQFKLSDVTGYRKIIDFKNRTVDTGLYVFNGELSFFGSVAGTSSVVAANTFVDVILTRNASTKAVVGYVNGIQQFTFVDTASVAVFSSAANIAWFFDDDLATNHEYGAGVVRHIRTFGGAITAAQAKTLGTGGAAPTAIQDFTQSLAAGQTVTNLNFGEKKIV